MKDDNNGGSHVPATAVVEPIDPFERGELDGREGFRGPQLGNLWMRTPGTVRSAIAHRWSWWVR
jgi:hypothetical protein